MEIRKTFYCSQLSRAAHEPVFGTASRIDIWLLLQYAYPWADEAFVGSGLPAAVKAHLGGLLDDRPAWRLLFMKQAPRSTAPLAFYVAVAAEQAPRLYRFPLNSYDDLLQIDLPALVAGAAYQDHASAESLFLVCTHGTHDRCCAKFGLPIYRELARAAPGASWQCSHVGGDRFAPNVLCFPHGIYYGHVRADEVPTIVSEYRARRVYLDKYRGRSCYSFVVQAAEYFVRRATGERGLPGFRRLSGQRTGPRQWVVRFAAVPSGPTYQVELAAERQLAPNYLSCKAEETSPIDQYRLIRLEEEG